MKWLPKEKRNPFIIVVAVTVTLLGLIYFGLLNSQRSTISTVKQSRRAAGAQLENIEKTIKNGGSTTNALASAMATLTQAERDTASGDLYSWAYNTMRAFKQPYKVDISEIGHPVEGDVDLLASFPYKQISFTVNGTGFYHDIGKFLADFENAFPHVRLVNLTMEPVGTDGEKLSFSMEVIALAKPNAS